MPIDIDRITNDPTHEHYAYRDRPNVRGPLWLIFLAVVIIILLLARS